MATDAQIKANRENAKKSCGPKTEEGKAKVARNAITHALTATMIEHLPDSLKELFCKYRDAIRAEYLPFTDEEDMLLEIYAFARYQQHRAMCLETLSMEAAMANPKDGELRREWLNLVKISQSKMRDAAKALKDFQAAQQNRMIAKAISEEFNRLVPHTTPFIQTHTKSSLRKLISPYDLALSAIFPVFEPKDVDENPEKISPE